MAWWKAVTAYEVQDFLVGFVAVDRQPVLWDTLTGHNFTEVNGEVRKPCQAAALFVELTEGERPARFLLAAMLPDHPIEPALNAAGQVEVGRINAEHKALIEDAIIEPVGQDEFNGNGALLRVSNFLPFVKPAKAMACLPLTLPYTGYNCG